MKKILAVLPLALFASGAYASNGVVHWKNIVGVITAQGVNNPVGDPAGPHVDSGTFAWSTLGGRAAVNLTTGVASFEVDGLVINGTVFSGTRVIVCHRRWFAMPAAARPFATPTLFSSAR